jgi:RNA polymerase sigma factor (sigma-70 family)
MRDDLTVAVLVARARDGDKDAWDEIVDRYAPLVWAVCRRFRLARADAEDVGQTVWLLLLDELPRLADPAALAGWLVDTTRRECLRTLYGDGRSSRLDRIDGATPEGGAPPLDEELLAARRDAALRDGLRQLDPPCRHLLAMLAGERPLSAAEVSEQLGIPVAAVGPARARCLAELRRCPAVVALVDAALEDRRGGERGGDPMVER